MKRMKRCETCAHGVPSKDDGGNAFIMCALIPPRPVLGSQGLAWLRPPMKLEGWCGQVKLSWRRLLFGNGS